MKKLISLVVAAVLLLSLVPANLVMAATFTDLPTGWSKEAMTAAVDNGLLNGYENGEIRPNGKLTRAEFAAILVRAFGAETRADISGYSDVAASDWYYDYIAKVVKMGAMQGVSASRMNPNQNITREEVFTAVSRVLVLESQDHSVLSKFHDGANISDWAKAGMAALVQRGYVNGDTLGNVHPGANITREEFAQFMHNAIRTYITKEGTYKENLEGIVVLRTGDVTLEGLTVTSDLVLGDGVMDKAVLLNGIKVEKRLLARGGTITIKDTTLGENVVVNNVNGVTPFKNYRDEAVFKGLVENTRATFLVRPGTSGGGSARPGVTNITIYVDGVQKTVSAGSKIESLTYTERLGYTFSWKYENGDPVLAGTELVDGMKVLTNYVLNVYPLHFVDADGTTPFAYYKTGYVAPTSFTVENQSTIVLPKDENIERDGFALAGWKTLTGQDVTSLAVTADLTVSEGLTLKAVWIDGPITIYVDDVAKKVAKGSTIESLTYTENLGYTFNWKYDNGTAVPAGTVLTSGMKVYSNYSLNEYPIHFVDADGTTPFVYYKAGFAAPTSFTILNQATTLLPKDENVERLGWRLVGWKKLDGTDVSALAVTQDLTVTDGITLKAVWEKIPYAVAFKNKDGSAFTDFVGGTPSTAFDVEAPYVFPALNTVHRTGYKFLGWFKRVESGGTVTYVPYDATLAVAAGMGTLVDVYADFEVIEYEVVYHATFKDGYTPETKYTILNADTTPLAAFDKVVVTDPSMVMGGWRLADNTDFAGFQVTDDTPLVLHLYPHLVPKPPVTVNFFRGYNTVLNVKTSGTYVGGTLSAADLPDMTQYYKKGYAETESLASVYAGNEYTHTTQASLWYVDDTNTLVPFTTEVVITKDTNVYILLDSLSITAVIRDIPEPLRVAAYYNASTRAMDSVKDMAKAGRQQLEKAISLDMIPRYDEMKAKLIEKLSKAGLIDENMNIKVSKISLPISTFVKEETVDKMAKQHVRDVVNTPAERDELFHMINVSEIAALLGIPGTVDEALVNAYLDGLTPQQRTEFADMAYAKIKATVEYDTLVEKVVSKKEYEINAGNLSEAITIAGAIRKLTLDEALAQTNNALLDKMINILGKARVNGYFIEIRDAYCDGLDAAIARVKSTHQAEKYTSYLTWTVDVINEILVPIYEKAVPKVVDKIEGFGVPYDGNKYLKYLVEEHNVVESLLTYNSALRSETLTGYTVKDVLDYYDYFYMLLLVGDDALCWYGDDGNVTPAEFAAVYTALFEKGEYAYARLRELAEAFEADGSLPNRVDSLVSQVKQISDLLDKYQTKLQGLVARYLGSSVDDLITSGDLENNEKVQKLADWLVGQEEPVITIDSLYELFYQYDDSAKAKLQELIDSGKLRAAVDKFESTSIGELFKGNGRFGSLADRLDEIKNSGRVTGIVDSVYDLLCIVAQEGIEPFRVEATKTDIATKDDYEFSVAGVTLRITRKLEF